MFFSFSKFSSTLFQLKGMNVELSALHWRAELEVLVPFKTPRLARHTQWDKVSCWATESTQEVGHGMVLLFIPFPFIVCCLVPFLKRHPCHLMHEKWWLDRVNVCVWMQTLIAGKPTSDYFSCLFPVASTLAWPTIRLSPIQMVYISYFIVLLFDSW